MIYTNLSDEFDVDAYLTASHAVTLFAIPEDYDISIFAESFGNDELLAATYGDKDSAEIIMNSDAELSLLEFVRVLGHELVHVKQLIHDDLQLEIAKNTTKFRGKYYRTFNNVEYWLSPWEIEARGYEDYFEYKFINDWK